uniref:Uncharacterized protein n=1 Tax=Strigamia maritima TaxID=126957 RepID=T1II30_STRMM
MDNSWEKLVQKLNPLVLSAISHRGPHHRVGGERCQSRERPATVLDHIGDKTPLRPENCKRNVVKIERSPREDWRHTTRNGNHQPDD